MRLLSPSGDECGGSLLRLCLHLLAVAAVASAAGDDLLKDSFMSRATPIFSFGKDVTDAEKPISRTNGKPSSLAQLSSSRHSNDTQGLTMVLMSNSHARFEDLKQIIKRYRAFPPSLLQEMLVIWNDPTDVHAAAELRSEGAGEGIPLRVIAATRNSMNNRFAVWKDIQTKGVVIQDDDMWLDESSLACLAATWRAHPTRLVGSKAARLNIGRTRNGHLYEFAPGKRHSDAFSLLLPHPWVLSVENLQFYIGNAQMTKLVDDMMNCDDIYMNAIVANHSHAAPIAVDVTANFYSSYKSETAMWVKDKQWRVHRSQCIERVSAFFEDKESSPKDDAVFHEGTGSVSCAAKRV